MKWSPAIVAVALIALCLGGCGGSPEGPGAPGPYVRTAVSQDIDGLAKYVRMPTRPLSAAWETLNMSGPGAPGPSDWYLLAGLQFRQTDLTNLIARSKPAREPPLFDAGEIRPWFSESLRRAWVAEGRRYRFQGPVYQADAFYQGVLHDGNYMVLPGGREILLELQCCTATIPGN